MNGAKIVREPISDRAHEALDARRTSSVFPEENGLTRLIARESGNKVFDLWETIESSRRRASRTRIRSFTGDVVKAQQRILDAPRARRRRAALRWKHVSGSKSRSRRYQHFEAQTTVTERPGR